MVWDLLQEPCSITLVHTSSTLGYIGRSPAGVRPYKPATLENKSHTHTLRCGLAARVLGLGGGDVEFRFEEFRSLRFNCWVCLSVVDPTNCGCGLC